MKFSFSPALVYIITSFIISTSTSHQEDSNPLRCTWQHRSGKSGYLCENGFFSSNEGDLWKHMDGYTSIRKEEPEEVKWSYGFPIEIENIIQGFYEEMNRYREQHSSSLLSIDQSLSREAQQHVDMIAQQGTRGQFYWHKTGNNGESTIVVDKEELRGVIKKWYEEREYFNFDNPESNSIYLSGDFSQMIWRGSRSVGCGIANSGSKYYVSCIYSPAGNVDGRYSQNVLNDHYTVLL